MERESRHLEYKEQVTKSFLKTVSAYANFGAGKIIFGVTDDKTIVKLNNLEQICLDIENMINDNIDPVPNYTLQINRNNTISLSVSEGTYKPYLYKNKAYKRNDSATIEVDRLELNRLVLEGMNESFEEQISSQQQLSFNVLEDTLIDILKIDTLTTDILKTLELMTPNKQYNNAAALFADSNSFSGIDIIRFGANISEIRERKTFKSISILSQFHEAIKMFEQYYVYEKIDGFTREKIELIPEKAFREALANSLVHRLWDIDINIKISMFDNRIEISSPGSLITGLSVEEYLNGQISVFRNPIIGNIFFRLNYIEKFGTGIKRINESYEKNFIKPEYKVFDNSILVILPLITSNLDLSEDEQIVITHLFGKRMLTRPQIDTLCHFNKAKSIRILNQLIEKNIIIKLGNGKETKYTMNS